MIKAKDIKDFINSKRNFDIIATYDELENVSLILKSEFIGIDKQIDEVITAIKPWLFFRDSLDKPLIINLVGLTGCGKTALVNRLLELLGLDFHTHIINGSDLNDEKALNFLLNEHNRSIDHPIIILDEFQNYKAKDKDGEIDGYNSGLWLFMDTGLLKHDGKVETYGDNSGVGAAIRVLRCLLFLKNRTYKNLSFSLTKDEYKKLEDAHNYFDDSGTKSLLVSMGELNLYVDISDEIILDLLGVCDIVKTGGNTTTYKFKESFINIVINIIKLYGVDTVINIDNIYNDLSEMGIGDIIDFLITIREELINGPKKPKISYKRSLIFILSNIDEAYHGIHSEFNPDISPDEFAKLTKKISIVEVKEALMDRFRAEHISRLGNTFIIYPSLDSKTYKTIISNILKKYSTYIKDKYNIVLKFDNSIHNILYKENVFPTLGVRPLQTGINDMIKSNFANTLLYINVNNIDCDTINYTYKNKKIIASLYNKKLLGECEHKVSLRLESLRSNKKNDLQTLVAVHESGHTIMRILHFNKLPISVLSVTADSESCGVTQIGYEDDRLLNKENINRQLKVMLGGMAAEHIIFGDSMVSSGSSADLENATELIINTYRKWGLKGSLGVYTLSDDDDGLFKEDDSNVHQTSANNELINIMQETVTEMEQYKTLLLQLSKYLSEHSSISQTKLKTYLEKYSNIDVYKLIPEHGKMDYGYKTKLKKEINKQYIKDMQKDSGPLIKNPNYLDIYSKL